MGGLGLMQEQISQQNHDDLGCDGWEISAHGGSAPDHEPFQGRQYPDTQYHSINKSLNRRIGTLNCGHSDMPIIMGVNSPQYTDEELEEFRRQNEEGVTIDGKHYTLYEATQRQRSLERSIRKRKAHILIDEGLGDTEKLQQDQIRLQILKQRYHEFSKAAGLPEQYERLEKAGFTWKHGRAAEKAAIAAHKKQETTTKTKKVATQAQKTLAKSSNRGTMKLELTDTDTRAIHDYMSAKSYAVNEKLRTGAPLTNEEQTFLNDLDAALKKCQPIRETCRGR